MWGSGAGRSCGGRYLLRRITAGRESGAHPPEGFWAFLCCRWYSSRCPASTLRPTPVIFWLPCCWYAASSLLPTSPPTAHTCLTGRPPAGLIQSHCSCAACCCWRCLCSALRSILSRCALAFCIHWFDVSCACCLACLFAFSCSSWSVLWAAFNNSACRPCSSTASPSFLHRLLRMRCDQVPCRISSWCNDSATALVMPRHRSPRLCISIARAS